MHDLRLTGLIQLYSTCLLLCCSNNALLSAEDKPAKGHEASVDRDHYIHLVKNRDGVAIRAVLVGPKVTDDDLEPLKKHRKLRVIECFATSIRGSGFQHLDELPELTAVKLYGSVLNDEAAPHIAKMKSLKQLEVVNVLCKDYSTGARRKKDTQYVNEKRGFSDEGLHQILDNRSIIHLSLPCHNLSHAAIIELISHDRLSSLGLEGANLELDHDYQFGASIETLSLVSCRLKTALLKSLVHHSRLRNIEIYLSNVSDLDLSQLSELKQLRNIMLRGIPNDQLDTSSLESELPFTNILTNTPLHTSMVNAVLKDSDATQLACMEGLATSESIHPANITFYEAGSVHYKSINWRDKNSSYELYADMQLLSFLDFINYIAIVGNPLRPDDQQLLLNLENRNGFDLANTRISDEFVKSMCTTGESTKTIEEFFIDYNALTDACLPAVAKLPSLTRLSLSWNPITDKGVKAISRNQSIKELYLSHCPDVSDAALDDLAKMPALKKLCVDKTGVTKKGLEHFQHVRPDVEIVHVE